MSIVHNPTLGLKDLKVHTLSHSPSHSMTTNRSTSPPDKLAHLATSSSTSPPTPIKRTLVYFWIGLSPCSILSFFLSPPKVSQPLISAGIDRLAMHFRRLRHLLIYIAWLSGCIIHLFSALYSSFRPRQPVRQTCFLLPWLLIQWVQDCRRREGKRYIEKAQIRCRMLALITRREERGRGSLLWVL